MDVKYRTCNCSDLVVTSPIIAALLKAQGLNVAEQACQHWQIGWAEFPTQTKVSDIGNK